MPKGMTFQTLKKLAQKNGDAFSYSPVTIGFLGDSVTNGCFEVDSVVLEDGSKGIDTVFEPENGYPSLVRRLLLTLYPRAQINLVNAGIAGDSAPGDLARIERDLIPFRPDLTVVCYGLNDCGGGTEGIARYHDALVSIIERLKEAGSEVILMTPQPVCTRVHPRLQPGMNGFDLRTAAAGLAAVFADGTFDRYMQAARAAARETDTPLCDVYAKWMAMYENGVDVTSLLANYLNHPIREMHHLFAWSLLDTLFA